MSQELCCERGASDSECAVRLVANGGELVMASGPPTMRVLWRAVVRELETSIFGAAVQIFPHSRRWSASDSSCAAEGQNVSIIS